ncbi:hypothetical protein BCR44DRAFT_207494 [Catenaria anguillulae PL171]|uniref:Uncharacterized protein n=1 Tax=Catenaria anguillulae PL171 TaxID=765915 RepID=A0A1Y2HG28_9FUNG|nr:hypothetical protein BCR44DRAFT_207494 [Catenaria anguillulae PL171]
MPAIRTQRCNRAPAPFPVPPSTYLANGSSPESTRRAPRHPLARPLHPTAVFYQRARAPASVRSPNPTAPNIGTDAAHDDIVRHGLPLLFAFDIRQPTVRHPPLPHGMHSLGKHGRLDSLPTAPRNLPVSWTNASKSTEESASSFSCASKWHKATGSVSPLADKPSGTLTNQTANGTTRRRAARVAALAVLVHKQ